MKKDDSRKTHRHFFYPEKPEFMIVVVFSEGENTILDENYVKRFFKGDY